MWIMKAVAISFLLISANVLGQPVTYGNFKLADQEIIYQKIFVQEAVTTDSLKKFYESLPYVSNVRIDGDKVAFDLNEITVDYKKFQFTQVGTPSIIQTGKYSGAVDIGVKDGKYRITLRNIQLTGDIGYKKITQKDRLTSYACKNNGTVLAQDWCRPNMLGLLDKAFTDKLKFVSSLKADDNDDW
jgi:hypothetical protein